MFRILIRRTAYMPLLAFAMALTFARLLVMARVLDVAEFATFNLALIVSGFVGMGASLGIFLHLQRSLPVFVVKGRRTHASILFSQAIIGAAAVACAGLAISVSGVYVHGVSTGILVVGSVHGFSQQLFLIITTESRSQGQTTRFAWQNLMRAVAVIGLSLPIALETNSALLTLTGEAIATLAVNWALLPAVIRAFGRPLLMSLRLGWKFRHRLERASLLSLLLLSVTSYASINVDRWFASLLLAPSLFAQFAFGWTVMILALSIQNLISASAYPFIARRFATHGKKGAFQVAALLSTALLVLSLLLCAPALLALDPIISRYFPAYTHATILLPYFFIASCLRISDFWSSFMVIVGLERRILASNLASLGIAIVSWGGYVYLSNHTVSPADLARLSLAIAFSTYASSALVGWHAAK